MAKFVNKVLALMFRNRTIFFIIAFISLILLIFISFVASLIDDSSDTFRAIINLLTILALVVGLFVCFKKKNIQLATALMIFFTGFITYNGALNEGLLLNVFYDGAPVIYIIHAVIRWFLSLAIIVYVVLFFLNHFFKVKHIQLAEDITLLLCLVFMIIYAIVNIISNAHFQIAAWYRYVTPFLMVPILFFYPLYTFYLEGFTRGQNISHRARAHDEPELIEKPKQEDKK